jgi:dTDP-glucose 4,6-dehydratase
MACAKRIQKKIYSWEGGYTKMKIVITGGAGFMGSNFVRYMVNKYPQHQFINFDKLTYAGNLENLRDIESKENYRFIRGDVCDLNFLCHLFKDVDVLFHFAAESHVDNSIGNSLEFTKSNAYGTHVLLEAAKVSNIKRIIHVSTDEVYGDILEGTFHEEDRLSPTNPYSASKAAAEMIVKAYVKTYNMPIILIRGCNNYGPYQYPEKIIPRLITDLMEGKKFPLHSPTPIRCFIHVLDFCEAVDTIFQKGQIGQAYNLTTDFEISNLDLVKTILKEMNGDESSIVLVKDRPFNDRRYSTSNYKIKSLGWNPKIPFIEGLRSTIKWYKENEQWWKPLKKALERNNKN